MDRSKTTSQQKQKHLTLIILEEAGVERSYPHSITIDPKTAPVSVELAPIMICEITKDENGLITPTLKNPSDHANKRNWNPKLEY